VDRPTKVAICLPVFSMEKQIRQAASTCASEKGKTSDAVAPWMRLFVYDVESGVDSRRKLAGEKASAVYLASHRAGPELREPESKVPVVMRAGCAVCLRRLSRSAAVLRAHIGALSLHGIKFDE